MIHVYNSTEIEGIKAACSVLKQIFTYVESKTIVGLTELELDAIIEAKAVELGAESAPRKDYNLKDFACISVNEVVCHGQARDRVIEAEDIVKLDISIYYNGYVADSCRTYYAGKSKEILGFVKKSRLITKTISCTMSPHTDYSQIATRIGAYANDLQLRVNSDFGGHGTGLRLHMPPLIPHFENRITDTMAAGHCFTIEPIFHHPKGWIAQFEHQVLITEKGCEVLI